MDKSSNAPVQILKLPFTGKEVNDKEDISSPSTETTIWLSAWDNCIDNEADPELTSIGFFT